MSLPVQSTHFAFYVAVMLKNVWTLALRSSLWSVHMSELLYLVSQKNVHKFEIKTLCSEIRSINKVGVIC